MSKISLNNVGSLRDSTTAATTINNNTSAITTAIDNTLSRDGTSPNQMAALLDMNSNQIINLPAPATTNSALRLSDLVSFVGGGTVTNIPAGGTTGQVLAKTSSTDYLVGWTNSVTSVGLSLPGDFTISSSPVTTTGTLTATFVTPPTGTGAFVRAASPTFTGTVTINGSIVDTGGNATFPTVRLSGATSGTTTLTPLATASGTLTVPSATDTLVCKATTDIFTNKTFDTAGTGNVFKINGVTITANTGTGSNVLATAPTLATSVTVPLVIGGTTASSTLTLESTSGAGTTDAILFLVASQAEAMRINTSKQLGIGTTNPQTVLTVSTNTAATPFQAPVTGTNIWFIGKDGAFNNGLTLDQYGGQANNTNDLSFRQARGTGASPTATASADTLGQFRFWGYTGSTFYRTAALFVNANETFSGTAGGADLAWSTTPNTTQALTQGVVFRASGGLWVGTGSTDPAQGGIAANVAMGVGTNTLTSSFLTIAIGTTAKAQINFGSTGVAPTSPNNGDFWFDGTNFKARVGGATKTFTIT